MSRLSCLALVLVVAGSVTGAAAAEKDVAVWTEISPGLMERVDEQGNTHRRAVSVDGLREMLKGVEMRLDRAIADLLDKPSERREQLVAFYQGRIDALQEQILNLELNPKAVAKLRAAPVCIQQWNAFTNSNCTTQSATAISSSTGGGTCPKCTLSTFVYVSRENCSNVILENWDFCDKININNGNCNRTVTLNFSTPSGACESYAEATISCPAGPTEEIFAYRDNCNCTAPPC